MPAIRSRSSSPADREATLLLGAKKKALASAVAVENSSGEPQNAEGHATERPHDLTPSGVASPAPEDKDRGLQSDPTFSIPTEKLPKVDQGNLNLVPNDIRTTSPSQVTSDIHSEVTRAPHLTVAHEKNHDSPAQNQSSKVPETTHDSLPLKPWPLRSQIQRRMMSGGASDSTSNSGWSDAESAWGEDGDVDSPILSPISDGDGPFLPSPTDSEFVLPSDTSKKSPSDGGANVPPPAAKKKKSHARKQPEGHIKRARNAFILFRKHITDSNLIPTSVEVKHQNISVVAAKMWKEAPQEVRAKFQEMARIEKEEHQRKYPGYRYQPVFRRSDIIRRRVRKDPSEDEKVEAVAEALMKGKAGGLLEKEIKEQALPTPDASSDSELSSAARSRSRRRRDPGQLSKGAQRAQKAQARAKQMRANLLGHNLLSVSLYNAAQQQAEAQMASEKAPYAGYPAEYHGMDQNQHFYGPGMDALSMGHDEHGQPIMPYPPFPPEYQSIPLEHQYRQSDPLHYPTFEAADAYHLSPLGYDESGHPISPVGPAPTWDTMGHPYRDMHGFDPALALDRHHNITADLHRQMPLSMGDDHQIDPTLTLPPMASMLGPENGAHPRVNGTDAADLAALDVSFRDFMRDGQEPPSGLGGYPDEGLFGGELARQGELSDFTQAMQQANEMGVW